MNDHLNGTSLNPAPQPAGMNGRFIVDQCKAVTVVMVRGMFSLLGHLQYEGLLVCIAQAMGETLAEACWCNDVMHTIKLRKKVQEALEHGHKLVPSIAPIGAVPQSEQEKMN